MSSDETRDRTRDSLGGARAADVRGWALVVLWARRMPAAVGEVALLPGRGRCVLGREGAPSGGGATRLRLVRQRPGRSEPGSPLTSPYVSREQVLLRVLGPDALEARNIGRVELLLNGRSVRHAQVRVGDVLELDREWVFLVSRRPRVLEDGGEAPFGVADEDGIVGEGPAVHALRGALARLGPRSAAVLVTGASGVGKELVARALHRRSVAQAGPLVACNAAALPPGVAAAELFGNVRDYPNAGMPARRGLAGAADGGTLFLDELGELGHGVQGQLLRLLDSGELQRLGADRVSRVRVRIVAATNRDPSVLKHDLAARFTHRLHVPGLQERPEDLPLLARHVLRRMRRTDPRLGRFFRDGVPLLTPELVTRLVRWPWQTHVRELEALLWRAADACDGPYLDAGFLPDTPEPPEPLPVADASALGPEQLRAALVACGGSKERTWRALGLRNRHQLRRLLMKHGLA